MVPLRFYPRTGEQFAGSGTARWKAVSALGDSLLPVGGEGYTPGSNKPQLDGYSPGIGVSKASWGFLKDGQG